MSYLSGEYEDNVIRPRRRYRGRARDLRLVMTVTSVTDTEVQYTRAGQHGIAMMAVEKFCELAVSAEDARAVKAYRLKFAGELPVEVRTPLRLGEALVEVCRRKGLRIEHLECATEVA